EEKAGLKKQVQDAVAKLAAMQQDYEKIKALHADLAGETGRKAEAWTGREQRLTSEKNQLKVDLERVQGQLSEMMAETNELHSRPMRPSASTRSCSTRKRTRRRRRNVGNSWPTSTRVASAWSSTSAS